MPTLEDIYKTVHTVKVLVRLQGCTAEFDDNFWQHLSDCNEAISEEHNLENGDVRSLPYTTELGEKSSKLFEDLKAWLIEQEVLDET